jgi:hypothetical protein
MTMRHRLHRFTVAVVSLVAAAGAVVAAEPLTDAPPVWWDDDRRDIPQPAEREPNLLRDQIHTTFVLPVGRNASPSALTRRIGTLFGGDHVRPAANVNALDEVPNSTWFTNRIGFFPMSVDAAARGPGEGNGPDGSGPWTIFSAKTEGVTPGFNVRDAKGDAYLIKFDPQGFPGLTTGPGAISARILWAAGYNVPEDVVVTFRREDLVLGEGVKIKEKGVKREMTEGDLDAILARVEQVSSGEYLAISSKFLTGTPIGPFNYRKRRKDDPNDHVNHENRRELRGLRVFAAWLNHFDSKQHNSLDMYVEEDGRRFVRHYLIDFASTLGAGARGPTPMYGWEFGFDAPQTFARLLTVGLHEDDWRRIERPADLAEVGYWGIEHYNPKGFKPLTPNTAFAGMTDRDGYWAAKIVAAFTDEQLHAICETAKYRDSAATEHVARVLAKRRDVIVREWFSRVPPIDFFRVEAGHVVGRDLGLERNLWSPDKTRYRLRHVAVDEGRSRQGERTDWQTVERLEIPLAEASGPFHAYEFQVDHGDGWSDSVIAYVSRSGRLVAVDR